MEHLDPCKYHLGHIVNRLSVSEAARDCDLWVFYDFVSLFQFERFSDAEKSSFAAAMQNMHALYAHECAMTLRIQSLIAHCLCSLIVIWLSFDDLYTLD